MNVMIWWVDGSYAVHPDMKSHTGGVLSFGKGAVYGTSTRQKLNTKSSTEAELVAVADVLPQVLWTRYFMQEQGYAVGESNIYQDNQSVMLLEKNGRGSSSKRTRHINVRYFFLTDRIQDKEVRVEYCLTEDMIGDFFTKPLQGGQFKKFRNQILNSGVSDHRSVLKPVIDKGLNTDTGLNQNDRDHQIGWDTVCSKKVMRQNRIASNIAHN